MRNVGQALVQLLEQYGVDTIFGIPGVHTIELYRGLTQTPINHVLSRHEQGAAFMADGYARASGKPGVCFLITGPGVMNAMTPMGQAYSDSVPILVISGVLARGDINMARGRLHEMKNQRLATSTVTAWSATAPDQHAIPGLIARAFNDFATSRPRPIHIEIPIDIFGESVEESWVAQPAPGAPGPNPAAVEDAAQRLARARSPVLIVGGGAVDASREVTALAETLDAPVLTTIAGKGVISSAHPLFAGSMIADPDVRTLAADADVVLAVGTELASPDFWDGDIDLPGDIVRIDLDPDELADDYGAALPIRADARRTVAAINEALPGILLESGRSRPVHDLPALRRAFEDRDTDTRARHRTALNAIREALPEDTVIATDMTRIAYSGNEIFPVSEPRQWLHPVGFGTLGYALPAGIGAALANPGRPTAALAGDYGFQFTHNELMTAMEQSLPLLIILWNNNALGEIREGMRDAGFAPVAVEQRNPDFEKLAAAYGCAYYRGVALSELGRIAAECFDRKKPVMVELRPKAAGEPI